MSSTVNSQPGACQWLCHVFALAEQKAGRLSGLAPPPPRTPLWRGQLMSRQCLLGTVPVKHNLYSSAALT